MRELRQRFGMFGGAAFLALAILLVSCNTASAQFPAYGRMEMGFGYPGWGYGGFYGYPAMGYGYGGMGYGFGGMGYGYPGMGIGYYGGYGYPGYGFGYPGFGYPGFGYSGYGYGSAGLYSPGLMNPLFGVGLTPLGVQSYMYETQVLGRRSRR